MENELAKLQRIDRELEGQNQVLEMLATGKSLTEILDAITTFAEAFCENLMCGILILDPETQTMHFKSAPSFPRGYVDAINGFKIGPEVPSCGTAAFHNKVIITEDVETDPFWKPYLPVARQYGIKACWSNPIRDSRGKVLGTFSFIPKTPRKPSDEETEFIKSMAHLAGIAIERKQVEKKLHFVHYGISHAGDEAFWVDWETARFVYVNAMTCKSLGYTEEELLTMTPFDIDVEAKRENWPKHQEEMAREKMLTFESVQKRKNGTTFPVELTSHLIEYEGKKYIITFGRDITDRKKNEAEIIQARDSAEKANQAKSKFLSRMSHEFRTPMNAILGFAQIMEMDPENKLDGQYRENILHILKAGQHLKLLIDDVLDLAVVESGNMELALESIPIGPVIRDIISQMEPLRKLHAIRMVTENLTESEHVIVADKMRFQQILINLISNAIKYNRKGGTLSIAVHDNPDQTVSIRVQDTGQGIPEENLDDLFEPFNRLNFEFGEIEGTGIGLSIVRDLVSLMKGTLEVESTVGEGSCFTVSFPLGDRTKTKSDKLAEPDRPEESAPVTGPIQILYIEDDPTNSRLVENIICIRPNLILTTAETAEKGIEIAKALRPDLILMDIRLPGIDGFEAFQRLRSDSQTQSIPVVAVTAHAMSADIKKAKDMGFDFYLTKPLDVPLFLQTIKKYCRKL